MVEVKEILRLWLDGRSLQEDRLKENGAAYSKALLPLRPYVVVDRNLYTGQNPFSAESSPRRSSPM